MTIVSPKLKTFKVSTFLGRHTSNTTSFDSIWSGIFTNCSLLETSMQNYRSASKRKSAKDQVHSMESESSHSHLSPGESMRDSFPLIKGIIPGGWKEYTAIVSFNMVARGLAERRGREKFFAETKLVEGGGGSRQRRKRIGGKRKGRNR